MKRGQGGGRFSDIQMFHRGEEALKPKVSVTWAAGVPSPADGGCVAPKWQQIHTWVQPRPRNADRFDMRKTRKTALKR